MELGEHRPSGVHLRGKDWCQLYPANSGLWAQRHLRAFEPVHIVLNVSFGISLKLLQSDSLSRMFSGCPL